MALFLNLYLGHLLGDFVLQPGRLVVAKRQGSPGLLLHVGIIGACSAAVLYSTLALDWPAVVLVTVAHLVIERLTILTYLETPTRGLFTLIFDQTMHLLSIALVVQISGGWAISPATFTFGIDMALPRLAMMTGLLATAVLGSILAFESVNALLASSMGKGRILRLDIPRLAGMIERGTAFAAAAFVHPAALLIPFVPRLVYALRLPSEDRQRHAIEGAAGIVLCALAYGAVQLVLVISQTAFWISQSGPNGVTSFLQ